MKKLLFAALGAAALLALGSAQAASTCSLLSKDGTCTFVTDTTGGQALFTNPTNLENIGSGEINPFLGLQNNGTEFGVNSDLANVNLLPLNDKRDNLGTFTNTFTRNDLAVIDINGTSFYQFLLDAHEPGGTPLVSIDTLRIWDAKSAAQQLLSNSNVTSLADVDGLFSSLIYSMGPGNELIMDGTLFPGNGLGYDLSVFIPTSAFAGVAMDSRLIFGTGMGGVLDAEAGDGFEEWGYRAAVTAAVPEPGTYAMMLAGLAVVGGIDRRRRQTPE
jgi:hypothetical protein